MDKPHRIASGTQSRVGRVLVVDDEEQVARSIARILSNEHEVTVVTQASDALERVLGGEWYDVILCDIMMPVMNGAELHGRMMEVAPQAATRIVFVTGGALLPHVRRFLDGVPNACLEKPIDVEPLRAFVARRVRVASTGDDTRASEAPVAG